MSFHFGFFAEALHSAQRQRAKSFFIFRVSHFVSSAQDWKLYLFRLWENVLLTRYIASLQYFIRLSSMSSSFFRRQWKSISMFGCFLSFVYCLLWDCSLCLRKTMIMFSMKWNLKDFFQNLISRKLQGDAFFYFCVAQKIFMRKISCLTNCEDKTKKKLFSIGRGVDFNFDIVRHGGESMNSPPAATKHSRTHQFAPTRNGPSTDMEKN